MLLEGKVKEVKAANTAGRAATTNYIKKLIKYMFRECNSQWELFTVPVKQKNKEDEKTMEIVPIPSEGGSYAQALKSPRSNIDTGHIGVCTCHQSTETGQRRGKTANERKKGGAATVFREVADEHFQGSAISREIPQKGVALVLCGIDELTTEEDLREERRVGIKARNDCIKTRY